MRIPSGVTDQYIYFVAVDATDLKTRETGLTSFTVYRSRNGGVAAAMTTPTVNETDTTNMPGVYELLLDEDMTIDAGDDSQEMCFHITQASMAPVTRTIELYRPKLTAGNTLGVAADGDISGNLDGTVATVTTNTDMRGTDSALLAASAPTNFGDLSITVTTGRVDVASVAGTAQTANDNGLDINTLITQIGTAGAGLTDLGGMSTAMKAEVNVEAKDVIATDTIAELGVGAPSATPTLENAIMLLYMALRNTVNVKTSTTTDAMELTNNAGTVICHKDITDDGTDYAEAEMQSGATT